ncbi:MAG TPA: extracellular solute-binding protein [Stellaceae bacterium]|nr:extracellular solute-binding protein [Stellaceae bacterium]
MRARAILLATLVASMPLGVALAQDGVTKSNGLSLFGDLKYGPDFAHFDYVNPEAPKGGSVRYSAIGTFDTLNPFTLKGNAAAGLGLDTDTLMAGSPEEPASAYGLVAETVEIPADRTWVQFNLRKEARFHDGTPMTPADVVWTFETLKSKGHPFYRSYYADVIKAEPVGDRSVRFTFRNGDNRELAQIVGELPVLSKAYWSTRDFEQTTLDPPLGSGPYKIEAVDPGRSITYRRVPDYWAANLPVKRGRENFDTIRYDYYRDMTVALEAFKAGTYDIRSENTAKLWATGYAGPALRAGLIQKVEIPHSRVAGMQAFGFNTRRDFFADRRVREAIGYAFDFEWTNKNLFNGAYVRTRSYFDNSELAATELPSPEEVQILEKYRGQIPDEVFTKAYEPPKTDSSGNVRDNLRKALDLLKQAGWSVKNEALVNDKTDRPMAFEILLDQPEFERIVLPFIANLKRLGIAARVRTVDTSQYEERMRSFDFDMAVVGFGASQSPGNEQRDFWGSATADQRGSRNLLGVKDKVVDNLIELVVSASDRASLVTRVRALDRVLLWGFYVVPNWHLSVSRVAYWDKFDRPKESPKYGVDFMAWWVDEAKAATLESRKASVAQ